MNELPLTSQRWTSAGQMSLTVQPSMKLPQAPYWPKTPDLNVVAQL
jgi:hypothetical protein